MQEMELIKMSSVFISMVVYLGVSDNKGNQFPSSRCGWEEIKETKLPLFS